MTGPFSFLRNFFDGARLVPALLTVLRLVLALAITWLAVLFAGHVIVPSFGLENRPDIVRVLFLLGLVVIIGYVAVVAFQVAGRIIERVASACGFDLK